MVDKSKKTLIERFAEQASASEESSPLPRAPLVERVAESGRNWLGGNNRRHRDASISRRTSSASRSRNFAKIDLSWLEKKGYVTPTLGRSKIVEEFRAIKRPILKKAFEDDLGHSASRNHIIMVTSSRPNEGKTFAVTNLAMSIASERGLNVLLVDGDVVKRDLPERLGFSADVGFLDLLEDNQMSLSDVLVRTNVPNLTVLPSGQNVDQATELLSSPAMNSLMSDLATRYSDRIILIDTPPILLSSETSIMASFAGQAILVVEADKTPKREIAQAVSLLDGCENISFVMNKVTDRNDSERFGAYYYYYNKAAS